MRTRQLSGVVYLTIILAIMVARIAASAAVATTPLIATKPNTSAIACMKTLPDGAEVCIHNKSITVITINDVYISEPDRSAGIKISNVGISAPPNIESGALMSCKGIMATSNGDRYITNVQDISFTTTTGIRIGSLAMSSAAIMGWPVIPKKPDGARITGLLPTDLLVTIWGRVTAKGKSDGDGLWYLYLDDGWGKKDGSYGGYKGIRVYCNKVPTDYEPFQCAVGVLTSTTEDPTPAGPDGDDISIPVIRTTYPDDLYLPQTQSTGRPQAPVTGRVRLAGQSPRNVTVRIYSENESVLIDNVSGEWKDFTIKALPIDGGVVTASAPGYLSETLNISGGNSNVDIELQPAQTYIELACDRSDISVCSSDSVRVNALYRDSEGKGIGGQEVLLTTTLGVFAESHAKQLVVTTDSSGFVEAHLASAADRSGVAFITAADYPAENSVAYTEIPFIGPQITLSASQYYFEQPGTTDISATLKIKDSYIPGAVVTFKTTAGVFQQSNGSSVVAVTDEQGKAQVTLSIKSPGAALITADYTDSCSQHTINWMVASYGAAPWYSEGSYYSNPLVEDLDGLPDGKKEVVFISSSGILTALDLSGKVLWTQTMRPSAGNTVSCSPIDSERSGRPVLFVPVENEPKMNAYSWNGNPVAGWPTTTDYTIRRAAAAIGDINLDGTVEIVAGDECCYVFSWNPTGDWRASGSSATSFLWKNLTGTSGTTIEGSTCALGDLNNDPQGILDVAIGAKHGPETYAFPGDTWGDFSGIPYYLSGWPRATGMQIESSPALGDIDGDGHNDLAIGCDSQDVFLWLSSDNIWRSYPTDGMVRSSIALCDLDGDGKLDMIFGTENGKVYAFNWRGQAINGWDGGILLNGTGVYPVESSPVLGDINQDGKVEVVVGCDDGNVYALYHDGRNHEESGELTGPIEWVGCCTPPGGVPARVASSPVIDDIDNDGKVEILAAGDKGTYIFHMDAVYSQDPSLYPWPTFHHDNQRTGCATTPPAPVNASIQGIVTANGQPVPQAKIYIYGNDGSPVYEPQSSPPRERSWVCSVGSTNPAEVAKGSYCINQLEPNKVYKIKVEAAGLPVRWVTDIAITTGLKRVDIEL